MEKNQKKSQKNENLEQNVSKNSSSASKNSSKKADNVKEKNQAKQRKATEREIERQKAEQRKQALKTERQALRNEKIAKREEEHTRIAAEKSERRAQARLDREKKRENSSGKSNKGAVIGLAIATGVLGATTIGLALGYSSASSDAQNYAAQIENVYKKNYYELADSVNSTDTKLSKLLASDSEDYQAEMLTEISKEASQMQANIASLPLTGESVMECVRFVNQLSGYAQTLEEKLTSGESLTDDDLVTLQELHEALTEMKVYFNELTQKIMGGFNIMNASQRTTGDLDEFSSLFMGFNSGTTDYPTMIYDGPFSDSVTNAEIVGLTGDEVTREEASAVVSSIFENISSLTADGVTEGKFNTFNFTLDNTDGITLFVQVTKIGGHILTVSGNTTSASEMLSLDQAETIALQFAKDCGIENPQVVWSDSLNNQTYLNIAPVQDGIVLYPDLVKVKVDMETGDVIGFDAIAYFTNHTARSLTTSGVGIDLARESVDSTFTVTSQSTVLVPLDYNREVVCYEFVATRDGATYYLYYNIETGELENVLKVLETEDGSKLM